MRKITLSPGDEALLADVLETFIEFTSEALESNLLESEDIEATKVFLLDVMEFAQSNQLLEFEIIYDDGRLH